MFDKTGTLTHGRPTVTKAMIFVDKAVCSKTIFLAAVGAAESNSEHPLATAITEFARNVSQSPCVMYTPYPLNLLLLWSCNICFEDAPY